MPKIHKIMVVKSHVQISNKQCSMKVVCLCQRGNKTMSYYIALHKILQEKLNRSLINVQTTTFQWLALLKMVLHDNFENTISVSIFFTISIITTIMRCHGHSACDGNDLVGIWAHCRKIIAPEARMPSKYAMEPWI